MGPHLIKVQHSTTRNTKHPAGKQLEHGPFMDDSPTVDGPAKS